MRLLVLNLNLGPGRRLQDSDLGYFINGVDTVAFLNSSDFGINDLETVRFNDAGISTGSVSDFKTLGLFKKYGFAASAGKYTIVVLDLTKHIRKSSLDRLIRRRKTPTIIVGEWGRLSEDDFSEWRAKFAYYGWNKDGVLVSDASTVTNISRLGVDHNGNNAVVIDFK